MQGTEDWISVILFEREGWQNIKAHTSDWYDNLQGTFHFAITLLLCTMHNSGALQDWNLVEKLNKNT